MKTKFLTSVIFIGIVAIMISSCSFLRGTGSVTTDNNSICSNYSNLEISKLPFELVDDMTEGYRLRQKAAIDATHSMDDTKAIWLDLETVKQFIYQIENKAKNDRANPTASDKLGLRIYYANYPDKSDWSKTGYDNAISPFLNDAIRKNYEYMHTIVMIPTIRRNGVEMDFDPTNPTTYETGIVNTGNITGLSPTGNRSNNQSNSVGAQNHGQMYPPYPEAGMTFN